MTDPQKLDYETPQPRSGFRWPPDWRRRLVVAAIAAPVILVVTFEAARLTQSSAVSYMESGGFVSITIRDLQRDVDIYTQASRKAPAALTDVPEIKKREANDPGYLIDPWRVPFLLKTINGRPTVISYGRDKLPGGIGLDADITVNIPYGTDFVTMEQFIQHAHLKPVLAVCMCNALLVALLAFAGTTDTRQPGSLRAFLLRLTLKAIMALFVATVIAGVHTPSGH